MPLKQATFSGLTSDHHRAGPLDRNPREHAQVNIEHMLNEMKGWSVAGA
jgi:hypothetical protein